MIFDRFHIVKHLNEAVDKTRRELVRELKGTARRNLKNTKFPLLKAKHNRSAKDKRVLREQVRANRRLYRAMLLRDDFMDRTCASSAIARPARLEPRWFGERAAACPGGHQSGRRAVHARDNALML